MIGLPALGMPDFGAVEAFRSDPFSSRRWAWLGCRRRPPSGGDSMRWAGRPGGGQVEPATREESADLVARHAPPITSGYEVVDEHYGPWIALDIDVSVFHNSDTKKQGESRTDTKVYGKDENNLWVLETISERSFE